MRMNLEKAFEAVDGKKPKPFFRPVANYSTAIEHKSLSWPQRQDCQQCTIAQIL